jgi:glucose/arabinose dehydrogenase
MRLVEIATGLEQPLYGTHAPGQSDLLYILEKAGRIRILNLESNKVLSPPFLDFRKKISTKSERGLLGLTFASDYEETGAFYIHYSDLDGNTTVSRVFRKPQQPLQAALESEETLLKVKQPWANHDGGQLSFGPDGMLYLGLGDGGAANDPHNAAQNGKKLLGKILRVQVQSKAGTPYQIPSDNPFLGNENFREEIWCYGLRNPWRFSFDRANGDLWIGDVGQNAWEEIDYQPASSKGGENYGLRFR